MEPLELALPLFSAFGVAVLATPWVGKLALAVGAVDRPNARKVSQRVDMPLLGGLAVACAFFVGLLVMRVTGFGLPEEGKLQGVVIAGLLILSVGVIDDRFGLSAGPKLLGQLTAAAVAIAHGFEIFQFTNPLTGSLVELSAPFVWAATAFWILAVTNALNLLDGLDGLASGVAAIIAATLAVIAWQAGHSFGICLGIALVGSLLGFLPHNFAPARIFLGDTGSLFVGLMLSLLTLECYRRVSLITLMVPLLTLAVPLLDTTLSIVRRVRLRAPVFSADRLHMHHRLLASKGSARAAVLQFYFLTAAFCLIAVSFTRLEGPWAWGFLAAVVALTVRLLWNLGALSTEPSPGRVDVPPPAGGGER
jgi:UDP-GlcNAc:undecaprenyl-phosphate GlcNAc-1-phosphate transferase